MILVSGAFTFLARLAGAVAGKTLGWAVILLFGRVPMERHRILSVMALASVAWLIAVVALLIPAVNQLVTAAVPRPAIVQPDAIGWLLVAGAFGLPPCVGAGLALLGADGRPAGSREDLERILRGYLFTPALAATIVFLAGWSVARALRAMRRGWSTQEAILIVKPGGYESVVNDVEDALGRTGLEVTRRLASPWFELPPRVLAAAGGIDRRTDLPRRLVGFRRSGLDVLVYPSAVTFTGETGQVATARAEVVRRLAFSAVYLTTVKEAQEAEDWLRELARRPFVQASDFEPIDALLATEALPPDDWDVLFRLRFHVEHEVLVVGRRPVAQEA